ncbi:MAG: jacalin-like lectin [Chloroflexota bacterium]
MFNTLKPITLYKKSSAPIRTIDYDVAVGIYQDMINSIIDSIYQGMYPQFLKDTIDFEKLRLSVAWDVKKPPKIIFKPSDAALTQLIKQYQDAFPASYTGSTDIKAALESSQTLTIEAIVPETEVTVRSLTDHNVHVSMSVAIDVYCHVELSDDQKLSIIPFDAKVSNLDELIQNIQDANLPEAVYGNTCYEWEDLILFIVNNVVVPVALQKAKEMIPVIKIPKLEYGDVHLAYLNMAIENSCIIATASIEKDREVGLVKESPDLVNWPKGGFFAEVSPNLLQLVISTALSQISPIRKQGKGWWGIFGYEWDCTINISKPQVSFSGSDIEITFDLSGLAYASVHAWVLKTGIEYKLAATSSPSIKVDLTINEQNEIHVRVKEISTFGITCTPLGDVVIWITSALLTGICNRIGLIVVPIITSFLKNLNVYVFNIPTITIQEFGSLFKITADNLNIQEFNDKMAVTGDIAVSPEIASPLYGGGGGEPFDDFEDRGFMTPVVGIKKIVINSDKLEGILSIQVTYKLSDDETYEGKKHGNRNGTRDELVLDDDEFITEVIVSYTQQIYELKFKTNKGQTKTFGEGGGSKSSTVSGRIVGFLGRSGDLQDAIGVYYLPNSSSLFVNKHESALA